MAPTTRFRCTSASDPGTTATYGANSPFPGDIDEVAVVPSVLSASDVAFLYFTR